MNKQNFTELEKDIEAREKKKEKRKKQKMKVSGAKVKNLQRLIKNKKNN
jgi:hypothetical protein